MHSFIYREQLSHKFMFF